MKPRRRRSLFGPIILVGIGVILLLNTLGFVDWNIWRSLLNLWPILIIAAGLDILFGRRSAVGSLIVGIIVMVLVLGGIWLITGQYQAGDGMTHIIQQPLDDVTKAEISIVAGAGTLVLNPLADNDLLIKGRVELRSDQQLNEKYEVSSSVASYAIDSTNPDFIPFGGFKALEDWELDLNRDIPIVLTLSTGVGQSQLNLQRLNLIDFQLKAGVGSIDLLMPQRGKVRAELSGGVGNMTIEIPTNVGVKLVMTKGLTRTAIPKNYQQQDGVYYSPNYGEADAQLSLTIHGGVGNITIASFQGE
ncbi:MAG: hypothetical protein GY762_03445 [Proteobacteria bacterium]|nr:hypothetical protein [Pseudomonadota bacterium]